MLRLSPTPPAARRVDFGGGAFAMVRPATKVDFERSRDRAAAMAAGVATSEEALQLFAQVAGLKVEANTTPEDLVAAAHTISLVYLSAACIEIIEGVAVGDDVMVAPLRIDQTALLCRDVMIANLLEEAIFARIAVETSEGNGSPPSRTGEPGAGGSTAGDVGMQGSGVPPASQGATASSALSDSTIH